MAESIKDCTWHIFIISYKPTTSAMTTVFTATNRNGPQRIAIGRNWLGLELGFGLGFRVRVYCWGCGPLYYYCCVWRWKRHDALHPLCLSVCLSPSLTCTERKKDKVQSAKSWGNIPILHKFANWFGDEKVRGHSWKVTWFWDRELRPSRDCGPLRSVRCNIFTSIIPLIRVCLDITSQDR